MRKLAMGLMAVTLLGGCWGEPETGPVKIKYDRETCQYCMMIISDPHFAAEVRLEKGGRVYKFDDIGGAMLWLEGKKAQQTAETEIWVRDMKTGTKWLDARKAFFLSGAHSPMDYGFGALERKTKGAVTFSEMRKAVIARGSTSHCQTPPEESAPGVAPGRDVRG
ncbi:MAG TPA: hypothetical protein ENJ99_01100 [Rhizobiales bacterium]|nr:hypothetical protein [Hyphomicrobiales bacterium]